MVDEKLEVEAQLRESEELFRAIVQNSSDAITVIDVDGTRPVRQLARREGARLPGGLRRSGSTRSSSSTPTTSRIVAEVSAEGVHRARRARADPGAGEARRRHLAPPRGARQQPARQPRGPRRRGRGAGRHRAGGGPRRRCGTATSASASLVQNLSDVITIVGAGRQLIYSSPAAARLFGFEEDDESWTTRWRACIPTTSSASSTEMTEQLATGGTDPVVVPAQGRGRHVPRGRGDRPGPDRRPVGRRHRRHDSRRHASGPGPKR